MHTFQGKEDHVELASDNAMACKELIVDVESSPLRYTIKPAPSMKLSVLERIYEATFGSGMEDVSEAKLETTRVYVEDSSGNRLPLQLQKVWTGIVSFFEGGATEELWMIREGQMSVYRTCGRSEKDMRQGGKRSRQTADAPTKVKL